MTDWVEKKNIPSLKLQTYGEVLVRSESETFFSRASVVKWLE